MYHIPYFITSCISLCWLDQDLEEFELRKVGMVWNIAWHNIRYNFFHYYGNAKLTLS